MTQDSTPPGQTLQSSLNYKEVANACQIGKGFDRYLSANVSAGGIETLHDVKNGAFKTDPGGRYLVSDRYCQPSLVAPRVRDRVPGKAVDAEPP